jgi:hypothetical protein
MRMRLRKKLLAIARLAPDAAVPAWATAGELWCIARTDAELSIVCLDGLVPATYQPVERGWRALELEGPIPFGLTGILASVLEPLAAIGIFAFSTFDTDYVLVKADDLEAALTALRQAGHVIL